MSNIKQEARVGNLNRFEDKYEAVSEEDNFTYEEEGGSNNDNID